MSTRDNSRILISIKRAVCRSWALTHWGRVTHICTSQLTHLWFRQWLVTWSAPSRYLNQWWNIVNWTFRNKLRWNLNRNSFIFIQENVFQNVVWKMAGILSRNHCVNPQTANGSLRGPGTHSFNITCTLQFSSDQHIAFRVSCEKKRCLATLKKLAQSGPRSLSTGFYCWQPNGTLLKEMYTYHPSRCAIRCLTGLQCQPAIFLQLPQLLLASKGRDFNLTQRASLGLGSLLCFCVFYEKCSINFDPYSLVLIIFGILN